MELHGDPFMGEGVFKLLGRFRAASRLSGGSQGKRRKILHADLPELVCQTFHDIAILEIDP
jgi:hypothetical protein